MLTEISFTTARDEEDFSQFVGKEIDHDLLLYDLDHDLLRLREAQRIEHRCEAITLVTNQPGRVKDVLVHNEEAAVEQRGTREPPGKGKPTISILTNCFRGSITICSIGG